jgi:4-hydroxythreonine-4-phosphate dehydrogenase
VSVERPIIGITLGDSAGIGPEIAMAALASDKLARSFEYRLIGQKDAAPQGQPDAKSAHAAFKSLEEAVSLARSGEIAAVVTGPVSKARMQAVGFAFPGQTEFFAARCGVADFAMLLTGGALTVALVTAHIPLREVPIQLRTSEIVRVGNLLTHYLLRRVSVVRAWQLPASIRMPEKAAR